jgi:hypothetical protein
MFPFASAGKHRTVQVPGQPRRAEASRVVRTRKHVPPSRAAVRLRSLGRIGLQSKENGLGGVNQPGDDRGRAARQSWVAEVIGALRSKTDAKVVIALRHPFDPVSIPHDIENREVATGIDPELNRQVSGPFPPSAAGHEIGAGHPLKVETRVRTPLGLQAKVQVRGHVQVEQRVSWAVRSAFVPRTTTTRHDRTCRDGRPGRVGCRLLRPPPPPRSLAKLRAIRLRGARPCSPGRSTLRP